MPPPSSVCIPVMHQAPRGALSLESCIKFLSGIAGLARSAWVVLPVPVAWALELELCKTGPRILLVCMHFLAISVVTGSFSSCQGDQWKQNNCWIASSVPCRVGWRELHDLYRLRPSICVSRVMQKSSVDSMASLSDLQKELTSLSLRSPSPCTRDASTEVRQTTCRCCWLSPPIPLTDVSVATEMMRWCPFWVDV